VALVPAGVVPDGERMVEVSISLLIISSEVLIAIFHIGFRPPVPISSLP
jgi:hypothetical protein